MSLSDSSAVEETLNFADLGLIQPLLRVLNELGYEKPSPIQQIAIPVLSSGKDIIGQAQTGTGKTAAFALPLLEKIDTSLKQPQALVLTPTRELAIQVAEAFKSYSKYIDGFQSLPIYGGQSMGQQLAQLKRGPQVIVGTPGRIMDHMRRGKISWDAMKMLVLDEADEMLRMGFIEDIEWILEKTPEKKQVALFSATMPREIRRVADKFLESPEEIKIKSKTSTATTIKQQYITVTNHHKLDALTRLLEVEETDGVIIFVRTKTSSQDLTDKLLARGYTTAAINGDMQQSARESTIDRLKKGKLDILVATDVAARGLDVTRISHVINYDITQDVESYVHRIGRTGRAGKAGTAILFVTPREKRMLSLIEKVTKQKVERIGLPSAKEINDQRIENFKLKITERIDSGNLQPYLEILQDYQYETNQAGIQIAAALASLGHENSPLLLEDLVLEDKSSDSRESKNKKERQNKRDFKSGDGSRKREGRKNTTRTFSPNAEALPEHPDIKMQRFVIMTGYYDGVKPANVVGAISNEVDIESKYIGHITIHDDFTTVDLPDDMPKAVLSHLKKVRVCGKAMNITKASDFDINKLKKSNNGKPANKSENRKGKKKTDRKRSKSDRKTS
ncbi:MAG: DEAD/DEAH box helicase [Gammaproteobacteria bacterium]|nr:DEAD/DEAH box helicase [Gammaproteobacteria bacterium]MDH5630759.1 DEAD/DEAH box helicase [Gammaproteobacteria bacterium]